MKTTFLLLLMSLGIGVFGQKTQTILGFGGNMNAYGLSLKKDVDSYDRSYWEVSLWNFTYYQDSENWWDYWYNDSDEYSYYGDRICYHTVDRDTTPTVLDTPSFRTYSLYYTPSLFRETIGKFFSMGLGVAYNRHVQTESYGVYIYTEHQHRGGHNYSGHSTKISEYNKFSMIFNLKVCLPIESKSLLHKYGISLTMNTNKQIKPSVGFFYSMSIL